MPPITPGSALSFLPTPWLLRCIKEQ
jgi:hypothetical protein